MHNQELKKEARRLRSLGYSLKDISKALSIAKSTASKWVLDILLGPAAQARIQTKREQGRRNSFSSMQLKRQRIYNAIHNIVRNEVKSISIDKFQTRLLCSFLYWGEGGKTHSYFNFTNSDPDLVRAFLKLFRSGFKLDESKFAATLHLMIITTLNANCNFGQKLLKYRSKGLGYIISLIRAQSNDQVTLVASGYPTMTSGYLKL